MISMIELELQIWGKNTTEVMCPFLFTSYQGIHDTNLSLMLILIRSPSFKKCTCIVGFLRMWLRYWTKYDISITMADSKCSSFINSFSINYLLSQPMQPMCQDCSHIYLFNEQTFIKWQFYPRMRLKQGK